MPASAPSAHHSIDTAVLNALADALLRGVPVLAPSERAARDLRARFDAQQAASGLSAWTPAPVLSWDAWLAALWSGLILSGAESRLLLNPAQEHALWRDVIATGPTLETATPFDALAGLAQRAWSLAAGYDALSALDSTALTDDARAFAAWAAVFRTQCAARVCLSAAEGSQALRLHLEHGTLTPPAELLLLGFDEVLIPSRQLLLEALTTRGTRLTHFKPSATAGATRLIAACTDPNEESRAAAHWVRTFVAGRTAQGLSAHVALVVPQLDEERTALEATLREILAPELDDIAADPTAGPYIFSTGAPLAGVALAATALDLLRWLATPLDPDHVTALLLSPYLGAPDDLPARAAFDAVRLRGTPRLRPELDIAQVARLAQNAQPWAACLRPLLDRATEISTRNSTRSFGDWMELFRTTLRDAGWPGSRSLTPQEAANLRTWEHTLDAVATLDFAGARVPFATALAALERQARDTRTTPLRSRASIQIMRPADLPGTPFDATLFLRSTDANLPAPERANPLLSFRLQRDLHMPGADPGATTARGQRFLQAALASASNVLFLYAAQDDTGPQRLSPLVAALGLPQVEAASSLPIPAPAPPLTEDLIKDTAPLPALTSTEVRGGAQLLKAQAACAFSAFAQIRLGSNPVDALALGFNALESGSFLHETLSAFWREVASQANLRALSAAEREATLRRAIDASLPRSIRPETPWDEAYLALYRDRLTTLLNRWLNEELRRAPFTIAALEEKKRITVGPLTFNLRIDRLDAVDGGAVLIDYKTSRGINTQSWEGDRPAEPQLPLYAMLPEAEDLQAIAFASLRPGKEMKWHGYAAAAGLIPGAKAFPSSTVTEQIAAWRTVLEKLAHDFAAGVADVSPLDPPHTCRYCEHRLLCRVDLIALTAHQDPAEDADG